MKKMAMIFLLAVALLLCSCTGGKSQYVDPDTGVLDINKYVSSLSGLKTAQFKDEAELLLHPLKDAMDRYGDDYEFICEGSYAQVKFRKADCSFEVYIGSAYESFNNALDPEEYDLMEYLAYAQIEKVVFHEKGYRLFDGISLGMTAGEVCEKLNVTGLSYEETSSMTTAEYNEAGDWVYAYYITGQISDVDYAVVFAGDVLARVELTKPSRYLSEGSGLSGHGKQTIKDAFSFVSKNGLAAFALEDLTYRGEIYSSHYDSWFYSWQFTQGKYADYEICVEKNAPNRIYIAPPSFSVPLIFWCDGQYVDPVLSFLGKWRELDSKEYIDIKSISAEGIVVFDMYVYKDLNSPELVLLRNLSTALNDLPRTLDEYLFAEYMDEALDGDAQLFDGNVQSGYYGYAGDKYYLIDSLLLDLNGSVQYLPRGMGGRVGAGPLSFHIPAENTDYTQPSTWGYMENFGRDDPNEENVVSQDVPAGAAVINEYLNHVYETSDLNYADLEYRYLHDYLFPVNDRIYHVWESVSAEEPHYLYVDEENRLLIRECELSPISRHSKELVFKADTVVSDRSYAQQTFVSLDGKITVDLINKQITKADSFVDQIAFPNLHMDSVGKNTRLMFFAEIGNRFMLNGYILFDMTTWGATLHITDSNIPEFAIGVYPLSSETFLLDPTVGVIGVPKEDGDQYLDDQVQDLETETKLVIREYSGKIIGYVYVDAQGKKTAKDFYGKILGYYYPDRDVTTDFYGKIIARGDVVASLLFTN